MCGFTGFINKDGNNSNLGDIIEMTKAIRHRGPDDTGIALFSSDEKTIKETDLTLQDNYSGNYNGAIGFNRLSILDLSLNGHQPMIDFEKKLILAYNGEVYNALAYKDYLKSKGFTFKSETDTEVIFYLYQHLGFDGMLERLNGMFAICIIDLNKGITYLARDRMGIKPMYYYHDHNTFLFSSEVKSFLFNKYFTSQLNGDNIDEYTRFGFITGNETLLKNVFTLEPGQYLTLSNGLLSKKTYWEIYNGGELYNYSLNEAQSLLEKKIIESLRLQLWSDVKIGCQLSGGVDSSLITLITANTLKEYDLNSISIILEDEKYSEEKWIDIVTTRTSISSHKYLLDGDYFANTFKKAIWHFDFPLLIPNSIGIFQLAEKAKEFFTVFLSGEGADELFAGYERFYKGNILSNHFLAFIFKSIPFLNQRLRSWYPDLTDFRQFSASEWYVAVTTQLRPDSLRQMKPDINFEKSITRRKEIFDEGSGDFVHKAQRFELKTWLVDLLLRQDKMTMANSIENRVPYLDHNIVDFSRRLPSSYLVKLRLNKNKNTKIILKRIAEKHFGKKFAYRDKSGFVLPLVDFYNNDTFRSWVFETIIPGIRKRGIFNHQIITESFKTLKDLSVEKTHMIWILISFETWAQMFLDHEK
jgi:asparagine synthase (glutamine-hydrolysing)